MSDALLRAARRDRVFDAMSAAGLDVLVLSRRDAIAYATGARTLWTAGTRPFGAAAVLVGTDAGAGRSVHLLSTWDEGIPLDVPFEHLYGVTWNPEVMAGSLRAIPGFADARCIGVDALSAGFARAVRRLAPAAEVVPADDLLHTVRVTKLPAEVDRIRAAVAVASAGIEAVSGALVAGASLGEALAAALHTAAGRGITVPASKPIVAPVGDGPLVHVDLGWLVDGYEGGKGRTVVAEADAGASAMPPLRAVRAAQLRLLDACRPGATGHDLRRVAAEARLTDWTVRGSGMGFEPPVVTAALGAATILTEGMVLSVAVDVNGARRRDLTFL
jgi:Xaa-Pro aminopeptidase